MSDRTEEIRNAILACRDKRGRITPNAVIKTARNKNSVLNGLFEWDINKAAAQHWVERARDLITRYVTVQVISRGRPYDVVLYAHDPREKNKQGYIPLTGPDMNRKLALQVLDAEFGRCVSAIERARGIATVLEDRCPGIVERLEELLQQIISMQTALAAE